MDSREPPDKPHLVSTEPDSHVDHRAQPVGHFLPADMPREKGQRILRAEALWRAGVTRVPDIGTEVGAHVTQVYEWARLYHWPARDDVVAIARQSVHLETMRRTAASEAADDAARRASAIPRAASTEPEKTDTPPGTVNLAAERDRRPMSEEEIQRRAVSQQAEADAAAEQTTRLFVEAVSNVVEKQQDAANEAVAFLTELLADAKLMHAHYKAQKDRDPAGIEKHLDKGIGRMRQLAQAMSTAIGLQRKVWMLDASASAGRIEDDERPALPIQGGSYEEYVAGCERLGVNLTPP